MQAKRIGLIMGAFVLSFAFVSGCGEGASNSPAEAKGDVRDFLKTQKDKSTTLENEASGEKENADEDAEQKAPELDFSFELEGKVYSMPLDVRELLDDGWTTAYGMEDLEETELRGLTYTNESISKEGHDEDIRIYIFNGTGDSRKEIDCKVAEIEMDMDGADEYSFALSNGLKPGDDLETVKDLMGEPYYISENEDHIYAYYGEDRESGEITFYWDKNDDRKDSITIEYYMRQKTESSTEVPAYLDEYEAPSSMGEDFDSATFTLDGVVYRLSCPVSELVSDGWIVVRNDDVPAGRIGFVTLEKKKAKVQLYVKNRADYQTKGSNCAVYRLIGNRPDDGDGGTAPDLVLPMGLSFSTDPDTLDSIIDSSSAEFEITDKGDSIEYEYRGDGKDSVRAYITYSKEKGKITSLSVERDALP